MTLITKTDSKFEEILSLSMQRLFVADDQHPDPDVLKFFIGSKIKNLLEIYGKYGTPEIAESSYGRNSGVDSDKAFAYLGYIQKKRDFQSGLIKECRIIFMSGDKSLIDDKRREIIGEMEKIAGEIIRVRALKAMEADDIKKYSESGDYLNELIFQRLFLTDILDAFSQEDIHESIIMLKFLLNGVTRRYEEGFKLFERLRVSMKNDRHTLDMSA